MSSLRSSDGPPPGDTDVDALGATEVQDSGPKGVEPDTDPDPPRAARGGTVVLGDAKRAPRDVITQVSARESGDDLRPFGPYTKVEPLSSQGAMGLVARAFNAAFDRWELVKFLRREHAREPERVRQFDREGKILAKLSHPNVVTVFAVYEDAGRPCLAMELLAGESLGDLVERDGGLPIERALDLLLDAARGLSAAHEMGLLHRDLKPDNLFVVQGKKGAVGLKLIDFGLATADRAHLLEGSDPRLVADVTGGTPLYMAPEQWRGGEASVASDLFALGLTFFVALAGRLPFDLDSAEVVRRAITSEEPFRDVREVRADVPAALAEIVRQAVEKRPEARFASAEDLVAALSAARSAMRPRKVPGSGPYRGLLPFSAAERDVFFGRDFEVAEVLERLRSQPGVVLVGPSGAGKSSLVHAGVVPELLQGALGGGFVFQEARLEPRARPLASLASALSRALGRSERELAAFLAQRPTELGAALAVALTPPRALVLVIDQLEELATLADDQADVRAFSAAIGSVLAQASPNVRLLATVRADLLDRLFSEPRLRPLFSRGFYPVRPLLGASLRRAVVAPAEAAGFAIESPELVDAIVREAEKTRASLPLVSFVMSSWWEQRDEPRKLLPTAAFQALGGLAGALARHADTVLASMPPREQLLAEAVLVRLVSAEGTRVRVPKATLVDPAATGAGAGAVLDRLVAARLVVVAGDEVEIVHEALVSAWPRLARLLQGSGEDRAYRQRVSGAAREWDAQGRAEGMLWSGEAAARLLAWVARTHTPLSELELAFYEEVRRRGERRRLVTRTAAVCVVVACVTAVLVAKRSERELEDQLSDARAKTSALASSYKRAEAARLRHEAMAHVRENPAAALAAGHDSWNLEHQAGLDVLAWQARAQGAATPLPPHPRGTTLVAVSRDGSRLASAGSGGSVHVLAARGPDAAGFRASGTQGAYARALALAPDGLSVAVGTSVGEVVYAESPDWKAVVVGRCEKEVTDVAVRSGVVLARCPGDPRGAVRGKVKARELSPLMKRKVVAFRAAADVQRFVGVDDAGKVSIGSFDGDDEITAQVDRAITAAGISADGTTVGLGATDGWLVKLSVKGRAVATNSPVGAVHPGGPTAIEIGAHGEIVSIGAEGFARVEHDGMVRTFGVGERPAIAIARDRSVVLLAGRGDEALVVGGKLADGLARLRGATGEVTSVAVDAKATIALVGARDGGVRAYSLDAVAPIVTRVVGSTNACVLAADATSIACYARDGWDVEALVGSPYPAGSTKPSGSASARPLALSPRGEHVVAVASSAALIDASPLDGPVPRLAAYSPDGNLLALVHDEGGASVVELRSLGHTARVTTPGAVTSLAWLKSGKTLLVGQKAGSLSVIESDRVARTLALAQVDGAIGAVAATDDGALFGAAGPGGRVVVVRADGSNERALGNVGGPASCLAFSLDGRAVVAATRAPRVSVLDVDGGGSFSVDAPQGVSSCARSPAADRFGFVGVDGAAWMRAFEFQPLVADKPPTPALEPVPVAAWKGLPRW